MSTPLTDIDQLRDLKARYCRLADSKKWEEMAALFTSDGVMRFYDSSGVLTRETAAVDIPSVIGGSVAGGQPIHHVFSHEIEISSETTANGIWAMEDLIFHEKAAEPDAPYATMHGFGHYTETYRKVDGNWRFATIDLTRLRVDFTY